MLQSFRGTSCAVKASQAVIDRINDVKPSEVTSTLDAFEKLIAAAATVVKRLHPYDLELLVDLVFSSTMRADSALFPHRYSAARAFPESPHGLSPAEPVGGHQGDDPGEHQDSKQVTRHGAVLT
jgi:hypothetical protein